MHVRGAAQRHLRVALDQPRRRARPQRHRRRARRRGRRVHAQRAVSRPTAQRLVDNHTTIDHAQPHCGSREVYKGILGGSTRAASSTARSSSVPTRRRPTPSRPTRRCCSPRTRRSTRSRSSRSSPTTSSARTAPPSASSTTRRCSTCGRAGLSDAAGARIMLIHAFAADVLNRVPLEPLRARRVACSAAGARPACRMRDDAMTSDASSLAAAAFDVAGDPQRLSDPAASACTASRSSTSTTPRRRRSRRRSSIGWSRYYARREREHPSRRPPAQRARDRRLRAARETVRRFLNAAEPRRDRLRARHDRGDQPRGADLRPRARRAGRRGGHLGDGAPLEHRAVADALRGEGRAAAGHSDHRRGELQPRRVRDAC